MATTLIRQADARVARGLAPAATADGSRQHRHPDAGPAGSGCRSRPCHPTTSPTAAAPVPRR